MGNTKAANRNNGIDILKFICSFMVVYIHAPIFRDHAEVTIPLVQIAVPSFFMITGYYYISLEERGKVKAQLCKLLKLTLWSTIFYIAINLCGQENPLG